MEVSDKKKIKDHQANLTESINKKELVEKLNVIKVNAAQLSCSNKREKGMNDQTESTPLRSKKRNFEKEKKGK